jgi:hypothetical protein
VRLKPDREICSDNQKETTVITILIAVLIWEGVCARWYVRKVDATECALAATFGGAIVFAVTVMVATGLGAIAPKQTVLSFTYPLVALRSQDAVSGSFFLGSGQIGSDLYYSWYEGMQDGGLVPHRIIASTRTRIYEEATSAPELRVYVDVLREGWWRRFVLDQDQEQTITFHIPIGSVKRGFSL